MSSKDLLKHACDVVNSGGVIVYPTESVYGLGCDPFNQKAVGKLLKLKQRSVEKGLILIAAHVRQILPLIAPIQSDDLARALKTWPGHYTWIFPKSSKVPNWISGNYNTIAIRVSKHPIVKSLCNRLNAPLVSTSANITNQNILKSIKDIESCFGDKIGAYINEPVGEKASSSSIIDAHTLKILR